MPNHFHLLLHEKKEGGISEFMKKLLTAYAKYFNTKYQRTGSLYESTFKATHLDNDNYLQYIYFYINLNPIKLIFPHWKDGDDGQKYFDKQKAKNFVEKYHYSSYLDHLGLKREESKIINQSTFPDYFSDSIDDFEKMVDFWLTYQEEET